MGAVASAGRLPVTPPDFTDRARTVLDQLGTILTELAATIAAAELVADTRVVAR